VADELARIAYETSLRTLDKQELLLTELRARTGLLLAASSLAASFLGQPAIDDGFLALAVTALVAFAVCVAASLFVLFPRRDLVFALAGSRLFEQLFAFSADPAEVHRRLAYDLDRFWVGNDRTITRVVSAFRLATIALGLEVALLLVSRGATLV
jgi:hypothetical protein